MGTRKGPNRIMTRPTPETPTAQLTPDCGIHWYFSVNCTSAPCEVSKAPNAASDNPNVTNEVTNAMALAPPRAFFDSAQMISGPTTGTTTRMESQGRLSNIDVIPLPRVPSTRTANTTATRITTPASMVAAYERT